MVVRTILWAVLRAVVTALRTLRATLCATHLGHGSLPCFFESLGICLDISDILILDSLFQACESSIDSIPLLCRNLVAIVLEVLLGLEAESIGIVNLVDSFLLSLVGSLIGLGLITHSLNLIFTQS